MTRRACDTGVLVAALLPWHDADEAARAALATVTHLPAHVVIETYSVLTRLPAPHRVAPADAAQALSQLSLAVIGLPEDAVLRLPQRLAGAGVAGGPTYDGLIAATIVHHRLPLESCDERARRTYTRLGVDLA